MFPVDLFENDACFLMNLEDRCNSGRCVVGSTGPYCECPESVNGPLCEFEFEYTGMIF